MYTKFHDIFRTAVLPVHYLDSIFKYLLSDITDISDNSLIIIKQI